MEDNYLKILLSQIPNYSQRQDGTMDQLKDLIYVANKLGMYDAADYIKKLIIKDVKIYDKNSNIVK